MLGKLNVTVNVAKVLRALLDDVNRPQFGYGLMKVTKLTSGSLYPVLSRMERAGWIIGEFEDIDESAEGRPARRFYLLTAHGREHARLALAELHEQTRTAPSTANGGLFLPPYPWPT